jgi:hypothetical protein
VRVGPRPAVEPPGTRSVDVDAIAPRVFRTGRTFVDRVASWIGAIDPIWLGQFALCLLAVVIAQTEFLRAAVPPGVDPAHWLASSYAWVGLPYPDVASAGSPYAYAPLVFPLLGLTYRLMDNPLSADFLFSDLLLLFFGLSTLHLARVLLNRRPILQPVFLAAVLFSPLIVQMEFWGAYPNLLGFIFLNESLAFLVLYLRSLRPIHALGLWVNASLLYLAHNLTFVVFGALVLLVVLLMALLRRRPWIPLLRMANVLGMGLLLITAAVLQAVYFHFGISLPSYFTGNPAAYTIDNLGEFWEPFGLPATDPWTAFAILTATGASVFVLVLIVHRLRPRALDRAWIVAVSWLMASLWVPAFGWAAHVDTDYTRFAYFVPAPLALSAALLAERLLEGLELRVARPLPKARARTAPVAGRPTSWPALPPPPPRPPSRWRRRPSVGAVRLIAVEAVVATVALIVIGIGLPAANQQETYATDSAHRAPFLTAMAFLKNDPVPGSVLGTQSTMRWIQALTVRGAYDYGPTWLDFFPWQIQNSFSAYWAQNAYNVSSNNRVALAYSGFSTVTMAQDPEYAAYVDGVIFPTIRLLTSQMWLSLTTHGVTNTVPLNVLGPGQLFPAPPNGSLASGYSYRSSGFVVDVRGALAPTAPVAWINLTFVPTGSSPAVLHSFTLGLSSAAATSSLSHSPQVSAIVPVPGVPGAFQWDVTGPLGQLPSPYRLATYGYFSPAPIPNSVAVNASPSASPHLLATFANPNPSAGARWSLSLRLTTPQATNPAIVVPTWFSSAAWMAANHVRFLVVPNLYGYLAEVQYFEATYSWRLVFSNSAWFILSG